MGIRPFFGTQTQSGTAQPVFGTAVSAAFTPPPDPLSQGNGPGTNQTQVSVPVASTLGFNTDDQVAIGTAALFKPGLAAGVLDTGVVKKIIDATHLLVQGLTKAHAAAEWCVLSEEAGSVHIRAVISAAAQYIGNASTVAAGDPSLLDVLPILGAPADNPAYVFDAPTMGHAQPYTLSEFWTIGTGGDTFLARFTQL
jgi:hypothetical protein